MQPAGGEPHVYNPFLQTKQTRNGDGGIVTGRDESMCVSCGHDAGYNRAVVDTVTDELVGGLCLHCERTSFGTDLDTVVSRPWCTLCERDGFYALPKWQVRRARSRQDGTVTVGYAIEKSTVRICDGHFDALSKPISSSPGSIGEREPHERL